MHDPRLNRLAEILTCHSTKIEEGEFVLIEGFDIPAEMVVVLIRAVRKAGGIPLVELKQNQIQRELLCRADEEGVKLMGRYEAYRMERVQAYIGVRGRLRNDPSISLLPHQLGKGVRVEFDSASIQLMEFLLLSELHESTQPPSQLEYQSPQ
jgi:aminopeptidase